MSEHTPIPWTIIDWNLAVSGRDAEHDFHIESNQETRDVYRGPASFKALDRKDAAFIVRACNSHESLLKAAEAALSIADSWIHDQLDGTSSLKGALKELEPIRAAINSAKP